MSYNSEHAVIKMIPCKAASILRNISRKKMRRTKRQNGVNYYRGKLHDSLRVIHDTKNLTIEFRRELKVSYGVRSESLTYDYKNGILYKEFQEPSNYNANFRKVQYPFITDESQHFMQSLMEDKYFPTLEDFVMMEQMAADFRLDHIDWCNEIRENEKKRNRESWEKWDTSRAQYSAKKFAEKKSKEKHTSS